MQKKQVVKNATLSIIETILSGITLFVLYRYLLETIGIEKMGVWSIVLATTSVSRLSEFGISGGIVKFVAKYTARGDDRAVHGVIEVGLITISVIFLVVVCIIYRPLLWLLTYILPNEVILEAQLLLPYAMAAVVFTAIGGVFLSALEGIQRVDLRAYITIAVKIIYLILTIGLISKYGFLGLAYAQVVQAFIFMLLGWVVLLYKLPGLSVFPFAWHRKYFKEMLRYGLNFQFAGLMRMMIEPLTKSLLSKFGDLAMVGFYEMANRMVMQLRAIIISANKVLVPVIAGLQETSPGQISRIYKNSYSLILYVSVPFFGGIIAIAPLISNFWIGGYEVIFVHFTIMSALGWFVNVLCGPAYFGNLGSGELRWNTIGLLVIGASNCIFGIVLGIKFGGYGVVLSWLISQAIGALVILFSYHIMNKIPFRYLIASEDVALVLVSVLNIFSLWYIYSNYQGILGVNMIMLLSACSFSLIIAYPLWRHSLRKQLMIWLGFQKYCL